jgi:hypothetical protein
MYGRKERLGWVVSGVDSLSCSSVGFSRLSFCQIESLNVKTGSWNVDGVFLEVLYHLLQAKHIESGREEGSLNL